ncbi:Inosine/uridine-preferring nucleoside hydrolase [Ostreococcus tauri]|uniref:Inosine/uridine-preferring nucleoside hydrolase n=1 Tax=Ostreococcus tauri TaxID=70448 RepID=Q01GN4_OSTTA|nr:Inosine/uridine-preferring nucleoside hydrolase [Ostreococcus tauri]CAL50110.1 Inosine/uridine-preferring nucleoside hydrolase [Ostreococcus tauri]|eukprot:XP_003074258.1 Inosine/uridine-preferring nucleoside hydrolase [Ostreococcus tauri]
MRARGGKALWVDCDPGHDDAFALYLAAWGRGDGEASNATMVDGDDGAASLVLAGVSTVAGNQSIEKTTANARRVLRWIDWGGARRRGRGCRDFATANCRVYEGAGRPLLREAKICEEIHGQSGLDAVDGTCALPELTAEEKRYVTVSDEPAAVAMFKAIKDAEGDLIIVATGPLTNVALMISVFRKELNALPKPPTIFFMGGAVGEGNTGARAEFNIQCDPEAAKIVLESGLPLYMIPLEVTHTALVTPEVLAMLRAKALLHSSGEDHANRIEALLTFFAKTYKDVFEFDHPPLHDPCAVWAAIEFAHAEHNGLPSSFEYTLERVDVECASPLTYGQTVVDRWRTSGRPNNVRLARKMNVKRFWSALAGAIELHASLERAQVEWPGSGE